MYYNYYWQIINSTDHERLVNVKWKRSSLPAVPRLVHYLIPRGKLCSYLILVIIFQLGCTSFLLFNCSNKTFFPFFYKGFELQSCGCLYCKRLFKTSVSSIKDGKVVPSVPWVIIFSIIIIVDFADCKKHQTCLLFCEYLANFELLLLTTIIIFS